MKKEIKYILTDKTGDDKYRAMILFEKDGKRGIDTFFPNNEDRQNEDSICILWFVKKLLSSRYDYGWNKVVGILEGRFASDYCSVGRAEIKLEG